MRSLFLNHLAQTSPEPLMLQIESANGHYLYGTDNKKYLDLISGILVSSLGHSHPQIVNAVQSQAARHMHLMVYGELIQNPQIQLAELLVSLLPATLNSVYLVNSGTEAVEAAMKLAKRATGRAGFLAHYKAYHGSTQGSLGLMDSEYFTSPFRPLLPGISFIEQNNQDSLPEDGSEIAAIIVEPVMGEKGASPCTKEYLLFLRDYCNSFGCMLIFDEIQTGIGRTGTLFSFESFGVIPDILLLGKAFGGGMPLGAMVADKEITRLFTVNPVLGHITTFGGHPVCCAAAFESLKIISEKLITFQIPEKEKHFRDKLKHRLIRDVTGMGLLLAVHLPMKMFVKASYRIVWRTGYLPIGFSMHPMR